MNVEHYRDVAETLREARKAWIERNFRSATDGAVWIQGHGIIPEDRILFRFGRTPPDEPEFPFENWPDPTEDPAMHMLFADWVDKLRHLGVTRPGVEVPGPIRHIEGVRSLAYTRYPHIVYFLLHRGEVVYIGKSTSSWPIRISGHARDKAKEFDDVWYLEVWDGNVEDVERFYIQEFKPKYNVAWIGE